MSIFMGLIRDVLTFCAGLAVLGLAMGAVESIRPVQKLPFIRKEFWNDIGYAYIGNFIALPVTQFLNALLVTYVLTPLIPYQMFNAAIQQWPFWLQVAFGVLLLDFAVYVRHRFMHERLWVVHAIHHSPEEINWLTKYRLHPAELVIAILVTSAILYVAGFSGKGIVYAQTILMAVDIFNHANIQLRFPAPLCYLLSCPDYHKWHHAKEKAAANKNYVVVFPFIDLLFKSYFFPREGLPRAFGIPTRSKEEAVPAAFAGQLFFPFKKVK